MSHLPARVVILGMCCILLLTNGVQCKRGSSSSSSSRRKEPAVTSSKVAVRQLNGYSQCTGLLQVKSEDSWRYVCDSTFTAEDSLVACQELACGFPDRHYGGSTEFGDDDSWSATFNCSGQEQHLADCPTVPSQSTADCRTTVLYCVDRPDDPDVYVLSMRRFQIRSSDVGVYEGHSHVIVCKIDSPLKVRSFVLEVRTYKETSEFSQPAVDNAAHFFLPSNHPLNNTRIELTYRCSYDFELKPKTFSSTSYTDLSYKEPPYARLVGEESRCMGSLELEHEGEWRAVSQQLWSLKEAAVVCRQLHCGSVTSTQTSSTQSLELQPVWRFYSDCDGSESALLGCGIIKDGKSVSTVSVLCSDVLYPVNMNITSEKNASGVDPVTVYSPYTFYVNCSVPPQFPGGYFSLVFTGEKHSLTLNQTAVYHSTVFTFDLAEKAHSGSYSCIYYNTVSGHDFSSQSQRFTVEVEDAEDVLLDDGVESDHTDCSGTLLVTDRSQSLMVSGESAHWDMRHASIVCRQLGCGTAVSTSKTKLSKVTLMWRFFSDCNGSEAALLQCGGVFEWFSSTAINVICADKTQQRKL